jgi:hypothetical protein
MPDVYGRTLDVALSDIKRAGVEDEVEILGGGMLGVVDESNWEVCEQLPAAGEAVTVAPRLSVERSCEESTASGSVSTETATSEDVPDSSAQEPVTTDASSATTVPPTDEPLTAENNEDLASLLAAPRSDSCDESIAEFATTYQGRTIAFDGFIAFMMNHGTYTTRFDFLIWAGDYRNDPPFYGPAFLFIDKNYSDLGLTGPNIPESVQQYDNLAFVARVVEYDAESCGLLLWPVSTQSR